MDYHLLMKKKLFLLLILILGFATFVFLRDVLFKGVQGRLKIISSPVASVFLNNAAIGRVPFDQKMKEGEYMLKLIPEGDATSAASWQGKINIYKNSLTFVDRELGSSDNTSAGVILNLKKMTTSAETANTGQVEVSTSPAGAIVYLDNDEKGNDPLTLNDVPRGEHELSVFIPGFFRKTQKINVESGFLTMANFKLARDPQYKKITETKKSKTATDSAKLKKTFVVVRNTETGFLRVRSEPSLSASESARVKPNDKFELLDEKDGWFKINYDASQSGWILGQYAGKVEE